MTVECMMRDGETTDSRPCVGIACVSRWGPKRVAARPARSPVTLFVGPDESPVPALGLAAYVPDI